MEKTTDKNHKEEKNAETVDTTEQQKETDGTKKNHRKPHKILKILTVSFGSVLLLLILIAGWFGFVPGLSNILGAKNAKDLGVVWTEADYASYLQKSTVEFKDYSNAPTFLDDATRKQIFLDPIAVEDQLFTQEELTAAINSVDWALMPISNAQVRLSDNTVEVSGNLRMNAVEGFARFIGGVGYSESDVSSAVSWGRNLADGAPIYIKSTAMVENDVATVQLQEISIGRFNVPQDIASKVLSTGTNNSITNANNFAATKVTFIDSALRFTGTYPTTVYVQN